MVGLGIVFAGLALGPGSPASAELLEDPVEDLRKALKLESQISRDKEVRMAQRTFRDENVKKYASRVQTLGDLGRALMLPEWRDRDKSEVADLDQVNRDLMAERFEQQLGAAMRGASLRDGEAAANLIARISIEARKNSGDMRNPGPGRLVRQYLRRVTPELVKLSARSEKEAEAARIAAATALGQIEGDPEKKPDPILAVLDALGRMLAEDTAACRRSAAEALANVMRVLTQPERRNELLLEQVLLRQEVVAAGEKVVRIAHKYVNVTDKEEGQEVSQAAAEALLLTAAALAAEIVNVNPKPKALEDLPPPERPPTETERASMAAYAKDVKDEREILMPLMKALQESVAPMVEAARNPKLKDPTRIKIFRTLEQMGVARDKLIQRQDSIPPQAKEVLEREAVRLAGGQLLLVQAKDKEPAGAGRLPDDPLLDGLQKAVHLLRGGLDADVPVRLSALDALEMLGPHAAEAAPQINRALTHPNSFLRRSAARVIGKIGPVKSVPPEAKTTPEALNANVVERLAWLLEFDPDLDVRNTASDALARRGPAARSAAGAVANVIQNPRNDVEVRIAAVKTLKAIGTDAAEQGVPALARALADPDVRIRREAVDALYRFGKYSTGVQKELKERLNDPDPEVSRIASEALLRLK